MSDSEKQIQNGQVEVQTEEAGSLLDQIMEQANITKSDESYGVASKGVQAFMA